MNSESTMHPDRACPVCASTHGRAIGNLPVWDCGNYSRAEFTLVDCACGLIFLSPLPTAEDFEEMYVKSIQFTSPAYADPQRVRDALVYLGQCLEALLKDRPAGAPAPKILEVGAGLAWMARAAKQHDPASVTIAQDISSECLANCPWVDRYIVGELDHDHVQALGPFDVISLTHVLEHLPDPVGMLRKLGPLLAPGGSIFITMPHRPRDWDGTIAGWKSYAYNHVPAHLQYFSRGAMDQAAQKAGLHLAYWDASHEGGEALEAHIMPSAAS